MTRELTSLMHQPKRAKIEESVLDIRVVNCSTPKSPSGAFSDLLHPVHHDEFTSSLWSLQDPALFKNCKLPSSIALSQASTITELFDKHGSKEGTWGKDVVMVSHQLTQGQYDYQDVTPATDSNKTTMAELMQEARTHNCGLGFKSLYLRDKATLEWLKQLDGEWRGEGGIYAHIEFASRGCYPYGASSDPKDKFYFQVSGSQDVELYEIPDEILAAVDDLLAGEVDIDTLFGNEQPEDEDGEKSPDLRSVQSKPHSVLIHSSNSVAHCSLIFSGKLMAGDMLYVPKDNFVLVTKSRPSTDSFTVSLYLPPPLDFNELAQSAFSNALNMRDNDVTRRHYPHEGSNNFVHYEAMKQSMLASIPKQLELLDKNAKLRAKYSAADFEHPRLYESKHLQTLLDAAPNGLIKIPNFLPSELAERIYETISSCSPKEWLMTEASADYTKNNIAHQFFSAKDFPNSSAIFDLFTSSLPGHVVRISAGKYMGGDFIDPHDDSAIAQVGEQLYHRHIAFIYYLSKDWKAEYGGALVDIEDDNKLYVPEFNSVIAFKVPHWHQVEEVRTKEHPRYSIFGWYMNPGVLPNVDENSG